MEDIQDLELCVELTPEELEELKGGFAVIDLVQGFPKGIPATQLEKIQLVTTPVISNPINDRPPPLPAILWQQISETQLKS